MQICLLHVPNEILFIVSFVSRWNRESTHSSIQQFYKKVTQNRAIGITYVFISH